jgi:hypothetical protein
MLTISSNTTKVASQCSLVNDTVNMCLQAVLGDVSKLRSDVDDVNRASEVFISSSSDKKGCQVKDAVDKLNSSWTSLLSSLASGSVSILHAAPLSSLFHH